jgi:hypothetical protein
LRGWFAEGAVGILEGQEDAGVPEADDVGASILVEIGDEAWVPVHPPPLLDAEVRVNELRFPKASLTSADGCPHAVVTKADDVGVSIAVDIEDEPWVLVNSPTLVVTEVPEDELGRLEGAVAVAEGRPDAIKAEPDHVIEAVVIQVGEESGMLIDLPAAGFETELGVHDIGLLEGPVTVAERCPHAALAEPNNARMAATR